MSPCSPTVWHLCWLHLAHRLVCRLLPHLCPTHRLQSLILNLALAGDSPAFMEKIVLLAKVCIAYVTANWLSSLALQLYLRQAMQQLYTGVPHMQSTFILWCRVQLLCNPPA